MWSKLLIVVVCFVLFFLIKLLICFFLSHIFSSRFCVGDKFFMWDNKILCEYDYEEKVLRGDLHANSPATHHVNNPATHHANSPATHHANSPAHHLLSAAAAAAAAANAAGGSSSSGGKTQKNGNNNNNNHNNNRVRNYDIKTKTSNMAETYQLTMRGYL